MKGPDTRRNIIIGYIISLGILSFFAAYTYGSMQKARKENRHVAEALLSLKILEKVLDDILNLETGQRGYIITGNENFLNPYYAGLKDLTQDTLELKLLANKSPERKESYAELKRLINEKIRFIQATIKIRNEKGYEAAIARVQTETGRNIMDSIRSIVKKIEKEDEILLDRSSSMREEASQFSTLFFTILAISFLIILLLIFLFINKSLNRQAQYERQLQQYKTDLEDQVTKKTTELASVFDRVSDAVITVDKNFRYTYLNRKAGEMIRMDPDSLIGKKVWDVFPDAVDSETYVAFNKAMTEQKYITNIDYYPPLDLWQENHFYPSVDGLLLFIRDISARKRAEEQLSGEKNLLRTLIDNLPDYIYVKDKESRYMITNRAFVDLVGAASESETIGKTVIDFFGPEVGKINMSEDKIIIESGTPIIDRDDPILINHQEKRWLLTTKVPLKDKEGNVIGILGISKDITSRKEAEEQLKNSEKKYKLLFESNPMPMWMLSMPDRNFVDVNEAAIQQYGYTKEEFLKMNAADIRPSEDIQLLHRLTTDHIPEINYSGVWRHKKKNGDILKVDIITHDIFYENRRVRLVLANDVTEKLDAENRLQKSYEDLRQLTSRLQEIREEERAGIAREIHDELGQQLTVMKMDIAWLNKKVGREDPGINGKLKQLTEMLDETVKTVRRISSELRPSVLDDLGLVAAMDWHLKEFEKRSGIKTEFIEPEADLQMGDSVKTALYRILQESLTNVARHANAKKVNVKLEQINFDIILTIEDDGKGFEKEKITGKKTLGILGMKERASMLRGQYDVISRPGEGTKTKVVIPCET